MGKTESRLPQQAKQATIMPGPRRGRSWVLVIYKGSSAGLDGWDGDMIGRSCW